MREITYAIWNKCTLVLAGAVLLLATTPAEPAAAQIRLPEAAPVAFENVTVIDMTGSAPQPGMTVLIDGETIVATGRPGSIDVPDGVEVMDATGKYMIPGLWDMHVHIPFFFTGNAVRDIDIPLFIANGVLGVRQMWGRREAIALRNSINEGRILGPRLVVVSPIVDGPQPYRNGFLAVATAADARDAVRKVQRWGYRESIKVYSTLPREAFFAMAEEVRQRGMDIVGHVPMLVTAAEASDAGQRSIEHLTGISLSCADNEATLRPQIAAAVAALTGPATPQHRATFIRSEIDPIFDPAGRKCRALFEKFVTNGTYLVPTLTILARVERARDAADPRLRYVHPRNVQFWLKHEPWPVGDRLYQRARATVAAAHESGVKIMAGTDTVFSGFSLHDELAELVSAGLSPMDALVTATRRPAEFLGELDVAGTIEVGKRADLVLLDANPLEDIGNTKKISAVVLRGRHLDRAALDALLEHAKAHR